MYKATGAYEYLADAQEYWERSHAEENDNPYVVWCASWLSELFWIRDSSQAWTCTGTLTFWLSMLLKLHLSSYLSI